MPYPINESFASSIPSGIANLRNLVGTSTVSYDAANQCATLNSPGTSYSNWIFDSSVSGFDFEADLELVSDYAGLKYFGFWLSANEAANSYARGFFAVSFSSLNFQIRDWESVSVLTERFAVATPVVPTSGVVTWRMEARKFRGSGGLWWSYKVTVGGVVFYEAVHKTVYAALPSLAPGIFTYGCLLRVHAVRSVELAEVVPGVSGLSVLANNQSILPANSSVGVRGLGLAKGSKNVLQGGSGRVAGTVTIENVPGARQVRLFNKRSGLLVSEVWSSPTGQYAFDGVDADQEYFVVTHDHLRVYNAVVQDMLAP